MTVSAQIGANRQWTASGFGHPCSDLLFGVDVAVVAPGPRVVQPDLRAAGRGDEPRVAVHAR